MKKVVIIVRYNVFGYLISEGFRNVFKNKKSTGASLMIMCATMLIFGLFFLIGENINYMVEELEKEQGMSAFMDKDATEEEIKKVEEEIKKIKYVSKTTFVSKEEAMNIMVERLGERNMKGYIERNPLPASYMVNLTDLTKLNEVKEQILQIENVEDVMAQSETVTALVNVANGIRIVSTGILVLLVIISVFIIANTIKLTVHARRKEISIMKYVGATNGFIRWPFIVEGIVIGIVSALLSILLLGLGYNAIIGEVAKSFITSIVSLRLLTFSEIFPLVITVYLGLGIGIGALGSIISMKKYLEV